MEYSVIEYPALVYRSAQNKVFVANCITKNLLGYGKTEIEAIANLEAILNKSSIEYPVRVKPVQRYLPCLG